MPASPASPCPSPADLLAFDRGRLPESELVPIADHLGGCPDCQARLAAAARAAAADSLLGDLRDLAGVHDTPGPPGQTVTFVSDRTPPPTLTCPASGPVPAAPVPAAANTFGPYQLLGELGTGGMGVVYRARDPQLKRTVALKMIRADRGSAEERARFRAEAEAIARLEHPNVVHIFALGEMDGQPYCALEFVPGGSLDQRLKDTLPDPRTAARLMIPIARGVQAAHDAGVVHRDLKPGNILLAGEPGAPLQGCVPKVTDFGLAKFLDVEDSNGTRANAVMGTPSYMAPEQAEGRVVDIGPAADVWALGAILYDLLTGRPPFKGTTIRETLKLVSEQEPIPPRSLQPKVPRDLETICLKCLQKPPEKRYPSAAALADDLQRFLNGEPITARPVGRPEKAWRWCKRKPALATLAGFSAVATLALLIGAFWFTYAVADEKRAKELAEEKAGRDRADREAADARQQLAEDRRRAAERLHQTSEYHARLTRGRERVAAREPGWPWDAAADIRAAAGFDTPERDPAALRSALAAALAGTDVRKVRDLAPGFYARAVCFHPDGRWVALAEAMVGLTQTQLRVRLVDPRTGAQVREFSFPANRVGQLADLRPDHSRSVAVSPDGRWLAVGTRSGYVHRWDLTQADPKPESWKPEAGGKECDWLAFAPDGSALYAGVILSGHPHWISSVTRWSTGDWKQTARHQTDGGYGGLVVHPLGRAVYCNGPDAHVQTLDPVTLKDDLSWFAKGCAVATAISPDGRLLALGIGRHLTLWDTRKRELAFTLREPYREYAYRGVAHVIQYSPDGRLLAAADEFARTVFLFDLTTGERVAAWRVPATDGSAIPAFDPTGRFLAVGGQTGTALLEIGGGPEQRVVAPQPYPVAAAALSPDGRRLGCLFSNRPDGYGPVTASVWDLTADGRPEPHLTYQPEFGGDFEATVAFRGREGLAFVADGEVKETDIRNRYEWLRESKIPGVRRAAYGPWERLWMTVDDTVQVHHFRSPGTPRARYENRAGRLNRIAGMTSLAVRDRWALAGGLDGELRLFSTDLPDGATELKRVKTTSVAPRDSLDAVALSLDETLAVVGTEMGQGFLLSVPDLTQLVKWDAHREEVSAACFLGPGLFATGGKDRAVRFWSWDGQQVKELWTARTTAPVGSLGPSDDGHRLAVACPGERGVRLWDLAELNRRFAEAGLGIDKAPPGWAVPRLPTPAPVPELPDESKWPANGLKLELFAGDAFNALRVVRHDPFVNGQWGYETPGPRVPRDCSARWTGFLRPPGPGKYVFQLTGENGFRAWLGNQLVIDAWDPGRDGDLERTFEIDLEDRAYSLKIEYHHTRVGQMFLTFNWQKPGAFDWQSVSAHYLFHHQATAEAAKVPPDPRPFDEVFRFTESKTRTFRRLAVSADGKWVAVAGDRSVEVFDAATGKQVPGIDQPHPDPVTAISLSPDGRLLLTGGPDGFALWDVKIREAVFRSPAHGWVTALAFAPDGNTFVTTGKDRTAAVWDVRTWEKRAATPDLKEVPSLAAWDADGRTIILAGGDALAVRWAPAGTTFVPIPVAPIVKLPIGGPHRRGIGYHPKAGLLLADSYEDGWISSSLRLFDPATGADKWNAWYPHPSVDAAAVSPDGRFLAVSAASRGISGAPFPRGHAAIRLYDLATGREVHRFVGVAGWANDLAFSADGRTLYTAGDTGIVQAWRVPGR